MAKKDNKTGKKDKKKVKLKGKGKTGNGMKEKKWRMNPILWFITLPLRLLIYIVMPKKKGEHTLWKCGLGPKPKVDPFITIERLRKEERANRVEMQVYEQEKCAWIETKWDLHKVETEAETNRRRNELWQRVKKNVIGGIRVGLTKAKLETLLKEDPKNGMYMARMGYVLHELGDHEEAAKFLLGAIEHGHANWKTWRQYARTLYEIWMVTCIKEDFEAAHVAFRRATRFFENVLSPANTLDLVNMHISFSSFEGALGLLNRLMVQHPSFKPAQLRHLYAQVLFQLQLYDGSIGLLRSLLDHPPLPYLIPDIRYQLARAYEKLFLCDAVYRKIRFSPYDHGPGLSLMVDGTAVRRLQMDETVPLRQGQLVLKEKPQTKGELGPMGNVLEEEAKQQEALREQIHQAQKSQDGTPKPPGTEEGGEGSAEGQAPIGGEGGGEEQTTAASQPRRGGGKKRQPRRKPKAVGVVPVDSDEEDVLEEDRGDEDGKATIKKKKPQSGLDWVEVGYEDFPADRMMGDDGTEIKLGREKATDVEKKAWRERLGLHASKTAMVLPEYAMTVGRHRIKYQCSNVKSGNCIIGVAIMGTMHVDWSLGGKEDARAFQLEQAEAAAETGGGEEEQEEGDENKEETDEEREMEEEKRGIGSEDSRPALMLGNGDAAVARQGKDKEGKDTRRGPMARPGKTFKKRGAKIKVKKIENKIENKAQKPKRKKGKIVASKEYKHDDREVKDGVYMPEPKGCSWGWRSFGVARHGGVEHGYGGRGFKSGDIVELEVDFDKGTISFSRNGEQLGVCWSGLAKFLEGKTLLAGASVKEAGEELQLLGAVKLPQVKPTFSLPQHVSYRLYEDYYFDQIYQRKVPLGRRIVSEEHPWGGGAYTCETQRVYKYMHDWKTDPLAWEARGRTYTDRRDFIFAQDCFEQAVELSFSKGAYVSPAKFQPIVQESYAITGRRFLVVHGTGHFESTLPQFLLQLAGSQQHLGEYTKALITSKRALALDPWNRRFRRVVLRKFPKCFGPLFRHQNLCARSIQALFRGYLCRLWLKKYMAALNFYRNIKSNVLGKFGLYRANAAGYLGRFYQRTHAPGSFAAYWVRTQLFDRREILRRLGAALLLQSAIRAYLLYLLMLRAAMKIAQAWRSAIVRIKLMRCVHEAQVYRATVTDVERVKKARAFVLAQLGDPWGHNDGYGGIHGGKKGDYARAEGRRAVIATEGAEAREWAHLLWARGLSEEERKKGLIVAAPNAINSSEDVRTMAAAKLEILGLDDMLVGIPVHTAEAKRVKLPPSLRGTRVQQTLDRLETRGHYRTKLEWIPAKLFLKHNKPQLLDLDMEGGFDELSLRAALEAEGHQLRLKDEAKAQAKVRISPPQAAAAAAAVGIRAGAAAAAAFYCAVEAAAKAAVRLPKFDLAVVHAHAGYDHAVHGAVGIYRSHGYPTSVPGLVDPLYRSHRYYCTLVSEAPLKFELVQRPSLTAARYQPQLTDPRMLPETRTLSTEGLSGTFAKMGHEQQLREGRRHQKARETDFGAGSSVIDPRHLKNLDELHATRWQKPAQPLLSRAQREANEAIELKKRQLLGQPPLAASDSTTPADSTATSTDTSAGITVAAFPAVNSSISLMVREHASELRPAGEGTGETLLEETRPAFLSSGDFAGNTSSNSKRTRKPAVRDADAAVSLWGADVVLYRGTRSGLHPLLAPHPTVAGGDLGALKKEQAGEALDPLQEDQLSKTLATFIPTNVATLKRTAHAGAVATATEIARLATTKAAAQKYGLAMTRSHTDVALQQQSSVLSNSGRAFKTGMLSERIHSKQSLDESAKGLPKGLLGRGGESSPTLRRAGVVIGSRQ
jgi:tetratricopeptide (TPR) repeat protein